MESTLVEILSVPYTKNKNGSWKLIGYEIDLRSGYKDQRFAEYPIDQNYYLPIGAKIENGIFNDSSNRDIKEFTFKNFRKGSTEKLKELPQEIYNFNVPDEIYEETYVYSVSIKNRKIVFFTYELFRKFLGYPFDICQYIFEPFMLEMMIDKKEDLENGGLSLDFNSLIKRKYVDQSDFRMMYANLLFHKGLNKYWKQVQSSTINGKNNFTFHDPPFDHIKVRAEIKEYEDFDLVLSIQTLDVLEDIPIKYVKYSHPRIKESSPKGDSKEKPKKSKIDVELSRNYDLNDKTSAAENNKGVNTGKTQPGFRFHEKMKFIRVKQPYETDDKSKKNKSIYKDFKIKDLEVSFGDEEYNGTASRPNNLNLEENESFDFHEIPIGLQEFCSAISILSKYIKVGFTYEVIRISDMGGNNLFKINGMPRYCIFVRLLDSSNTCFLEVDSSDRKYISTLIIKDIPFENHIEFVKEMLKDLAARGGSWNIEKINSKCSAEKIKHPRELREHKKMDVKDREKAKMYRLATKLINILIYGNIYTA